ncbi:hypothetical protein A3K01_01435 [candidate division WWE3 bacterium RIFOXYD1_FULL_43_17]|uniref:Uncharacterized protein n=3 Tax=Katanobacteria TaxID=422282 RepID=A0A1F4XD14_UNCKA|nr:MAG: hypothetical protein UU59_C0003G0003 [candidate division WWE3 bacterium GW2011_GWE1_41_27]KKS60424.1 MAG: hypothetical protein UV26_C0004G0014 [candidate division WWE3 bacterium GW2011_GWF2_42_42]OGC79560.1 MAG: hypothetical protein A3K01_01435 [candidate division WWE3 bacterium RIFOXYD1_FULL_43_17]
MKFNQNSQMRNKKQKKDKNLIPLYSFSFLMVIAVMLAFSGSMYGSYRLSKVLAEDSSNVLSDDDERDDDYEIEDEFEDEDEDEMEDENELEDEDEADDVDSIDSEDPDGLENENEVEDEAEDNDSVVSLKNGVDSFIATQADLQEVSVEQLGNISQRSGVVKFLIGPDFGSIKKLQAVVEANTKMLAQIDQLKTQTLTAEEKEALESLSGSIASQNLAINGQVESQESGFSLFGWLMKLLSS